MKIKSLRPNSQDSMIQTSFAWRKLRMIVVLRGTATTTSASSNNWRLVILASPRCKDPADPTNVNPVSKTVLKHIPNGTGTKFIANIIRPLFQL